MDRLISALSGNTHPPYFAYRANYEIKVGNSYERLYEFLKKQKAYLRQDDSNYLFLSPLDLKTLDRELWACVNRNDRISVEYLCQPFQMIARNMPEVIRWLERYVTDQDATANRGYHGINALLSRSSGAVLTG